MTFENAECLLDDWLHHDYGCDLRIHRSKQNQGCVVVETKNLIWAKRIIRWYKYEKVTYKN